MKKWRIWKTLTTNPHPGIRNLVVLVLIKLESVSLYYGVKIFFGRLRVFEIPSSSAPTLCSKGFRHFPQKLYSVLHVKVKTKFGYDSGLHKCCVSSSGLWCWFKYFITTGTLFHRRPE